jgi:malonyl-CoA O-methyltransferase
MALVLSVREGYDRWSELYDGDGNPLCMLEEPHVDRLLGDVRGASVADIGCGTGRHALRLAGNGARVTAVDFSAGMLGKARAKPGADAVTWIEHDLATELPLPSRSFDRVVCALVVDHIRDLHGFFAELRRIANGPIVVSVMHPSMMLKGTQARFHDPATGQEVRPESVAHQVSDYVMAATRARLTIDEMSEYFVDAELAARAPRAEKYLGWPMLLLFRFMP